MLLRPSPTNSQAYTFSGSGCLPGQVNFTQSFAATENVYPPFWYEREFTPPWDTGYGGVSAAVSVAPASSPLWSSMAYPKGKELKAKLAQ
jgi:hypothetical protein